MYMYYTCDKYLYILYNYVYVCALNMNQED